MSTPAKARMTPTAPTPTGPSLRCFCGGAHVSGACLAPTDLAPGQTPASEATPVEAAARALVRHGVAGFGPEDEATDGAKLMLALNDADVALTAGLAGDWLEAVLGEHADFTYVDTKADPAHFVCDCGHAFGYEDGAHAEWEAHLAAAIRTAAGATPEETHRG